MVEAEIYQFYNDYVKTSYSEIEAKGNALPVELLFEINSAFDHLKRFHLGEEDELLSCEKAYSHLKRGLLDVFKLKLKYFNNDCSKLLGKKADLRIIDSGTFLPRLLEDKKRIVVKATEARLHEGKKELEAAFDARYAQLQIISTYATSAENTNFSRHLIRMRESAVLNNFLSKTTLLDKKSNFFI